MQLNDLERMLSRIPPHPAPRVELEQYATPADLAAPLLFEARALGDIEGRRVADLGCGTGIFAIGAGILGAAAVIGIDLDEGALAIARDEARRAGIEAEFQRMDVRDWREPTDTVLMNPPFGAQVRGADRPFLEAAFRTASVVYSLHNAPTRDFVEAHATSRGFITTHRWRLLFALRHQYKHQEKEEVEVEVVAFRFERAGIPRAAQRLAEGVQAATGLGGLLG